MKTATSCGDQSDSSHPVGDTTEWSGDGVRKLSKGFETTLSAQKCWPSEAMPVSVVVVRALSLQGMTHELTVSLLLVLWAFLRRKSALFSEKPTMDWKCKM